MQENHKAQVVESAESRRLYKVAFGLALFTIIYNLAEGLVATYFGYEDESIALFGFGVDSFIEMISGIGIAHMILRIWHYSKGDRDAFERTALRVTGFAFYGLAIGLLATGLYNVWTGHKPEATLWGVIIAIISIVVMLFLIYGKTRVGRQLHSDAILADAQCTKVCIYMSVVLLASSGIYEWTSFGYVDAIGALGIAWFSYREGRECFEKAKSNSYACCDHD